MRLSFCLILIILLNNAYCVAQIIKDPTEAYRSACEGGRPLLIVFSGSDWCAPCMRFERQVLSQDVFSQFIAEKVIVYEADFPQRKRISKETQQSNEALAEQYNPKGAFPHLVLVRPDRSIITTLIYEDESVEAFIKKVSRHLEDEQTKNVQTAE